MQLRSKPLLLLALVFLASPATAQHKQEKHPEIGIERIDRPRRFDAIPTTPDEKYIQLKWIERAADESGRDLDFPLLQNCLYQSPWGCNIVRDRFGSTEATCGSNNAVNMTRAQSIHTQSIFK